MHAVNMNETEMLTTAPLPRWINPARCITAHPKSKQPQAFEKIARAAGP